MRRMFTRAPGLVLAIAVVALLGLVAIPIRTIAQSQSQEATTTPASGGLQLGATSTPGGLVLGLGTPSAGVHGNSYTSPTYGFTLSWPSRWHVVSESSANGVDQLKLSDGTTTVSFVTTTADKGNPATCRTAAVASLKAGSGVSNVKEATDPQGKALAGSDATRAWAVYLYSKGGTATARYIDCRVLTPSQANLLITADITVAKFNAESPNLVALLDKLSIAPTGPSASPATTAVAETPTTAPTKPQTATPTPAAAVSTAQLPSTEVATAQGTTGPISTPVFPVQTTSTPSTLPGQPTQQAQGTATEDLSALGVHGNTYKSPNYGFTVNWDSTWTVEDAHSSTGGTSGIGYDQLVLFNGVSAMTLTGAQDFNGNAQQCVTGVASGIKQGQSGVTISNFANATGSDGKPLQGGNATRAWGVYTYTSTQSGQSQKVANYIECRTLVPGQAVLVIVQDVAQSDYNGQIAPRDKLLGTIKIPAKPTSGGATTPASGTAAVAPVGEVNTGDLVTAYPRWWR